jgi:hypothetical protein
MVGGIQKTFQSKLSKIDGYLLEMSYIWLNVYVLEWLQGS